MSTFKLQYEAVCDGRIPVSKYKSLKTGLTVCFADIDGPIINGYICLATEAKDDDGLPHTLEHLVFLGSEDYPYKGLLDQFASRLLASGTNAWTEVDHTCFTLSHAGPQGFLTLLPIYMDHILYPTLTKSGYATEVHHIDGSGADSGVVYCEMQARENSGEERTFRALLRHMYPGDCGYRWETGGILKNLRDSTTHSKVKQFHQDFYRPENALLVVVGRIDPEKVFEALESVEQKIIGKGERGAFTRPWQTPVPPLLETVRERVLYPSDREEYGMAHIGFRGPKSKSLYEHQSLSCLIEYLDASAVSPVQRDLVEIDEPLAGAAAFNVLENSEMTIYITFSNVEISKLDMLEDAFIGVLESIYHGDEELEMERLSSIIHNKKLGALNNIEYTPSDHLSFNLIGHFLYGDDDKDLYKRLNTVEAYEKMIEEPEEYWLSLIKKYFVDTPRVVITGCPSIDLGNRMGQEEEKRLETQKNALGEEGKNKCKTELEQANDLNSRLAPESIHDQITPPSISSVPLHSLKSSTNIVNSATGNSDSNSEFPLSDLPLKFMLEDFETSFIELNVLLDTENIPSELRDYLPLYCDLISESGVMTPDGEVVPYEGVVAQIEENTLQCSAGLGFPGITNFMIGAFPQLMSLTVRLEREQYINGVEMAQTLLQGLVFESNRIKSVVQRRLSDVSSARRSPSKVIRSVLRQFCFKPECNLNALGLRRQQDFLEGLLKSLEKDSDAVIERFEMVKEALIQPDNIAVHMACEVESLKDIYPLADVWAGFVEPIDNRSHFSKETVKKLNQLLIPIEDVSNKHCIIGMKEVESSFMIQAVPSISDWMHKDLPALMVCLQWLILPEGPLWRRLRGRGLAYSTSLYLDTEAGLLFLSLSKATNIQEAYGGAMQEVQALLAGGCGSGEAAGGAAAAVRGLEAARSSLLLQLVKEQETPLRASEQSLLAYLQQVPATYNRDMLERISSVTLEDLMRVGKDHVLTVFDPALARSALCVNSTKVKATQLHFKEKFGINLHEVSLGYSCKPSFDAEISNMKDDVSNKYVLATTQNERGGSGGDGSSFKRARLDYRREEKK